MTQSFMQIALLYLDKTNWEDFTTSLWRCLFIFYVLVESDEQARGLVVGCWRMRVWTPKLGGFTPTL